MEVKSQLMQEMSEQTDYTFNTDRITYSSIGLKGERRSFVTGYISVPEIDLYNDLITPNALKSMLMQISEKTITLDYEHEAWRDDNTILPVGKIIEAKVDERGLWVKAELNSHSPKYKALWGSIKDGFLNAFSIAFKPLKVITKTIGDTTVRLIEDLKLLNVAITANPVNVGAQMTGHNIKSVMLKAIEDTHEEKVLVSKSLITKLMEVKNMGEENTQTDPAVTEEAKAPEEEKAPEEAAAPTEEAAEPEPTPEAAEAEAAPAEEVVEEPAAPVEAKALAELTANVEKLNKENAELKSDLKKLKESPVFKSTVSDVKPALTPEKVDMLNLIR